MDNTYNIKKKKKSIKSIIPKVLIMLKMYRKAITINQASAEQQGQVL